MSRCLIDNRTDISLIVKNHCLTGLKSGVIQIFGSQQPDFLTDGKSHFNWPMRDFLTDNQSQRFYNSGDTGFVVGS